MKHTVPAVLAMAFLIAACPQEERVDIIEDPAEVEAPPAEPAPPPMPPDTPMEPMEPTDPEDPEDPPES